MMLATTTQRQNLRRILGDDQAHEIALILSKVLGG